MADALLTRKRQLFASVEGTEGTYVGNATLITAANGNNLIFEPRSNPEVDIFDRTPAALTISTLPGISGTRLLRTNVQVEIKGAGNTSSPVVVTTVPSWDPLLRACGFQRRTIKSFTTSAMSGTFTHGETVNDTLSPASPAASAEVVKTTATASPTPNLLLVLGAESPGLQNGDTILGATSAATATLSSAGTDYGLLYSPDSDSPAISLAALEDGLRKTCKGTRGNVTINCNVGEPAFFEFELLGAVNDIADQALVTGITYESNLPPKFQGVSLSMHNASSDVTFENFTATMNNGLNPRRSANDSSGVLSTKISTRNPEGTINPEMVVPSTSNADWYNIQETDGTGVISWQLGSTSGNIVEFYAANTTFKTLTDGDRNAIAIVDITFGMHKASVNTSGDDEFAIIVR